MQTEPQPEHRWLQKFVGEWTSEMECSMGPDQPTMKGKGSEVARSIGDLWIVAEGKGEMPGGGDATMLLTLGYDPTTKRYPGTWIGSMGAYLWVYDGELDASKRILTLNAEGPSWADPTAKAKYRDIHEFVSDIHRILTSHMLGDDGKWTHFMTAHYYRVS
jgi:hypothetical protein